MIGRGLGQVRRLAESPSRFLARDPQEPSTWSIRGCLIGAEPVLSTARLPPPPPPVLLLEPGGGGRGATVRL